MDASSHQLAWCHLHSAKWLFIFVYSLQFITSGPVIVMELMGDEAVSVWRKVLGPTDASVARKDAPNSLRAQFGADGTKNAGHGSDSLASAARVLKTPHSIQFSKCQPHWPNILQERPTFSCLQSSLEFSEEVTGLSCNLIHLSFHSHELLLMVNCHWQCSSS